MEPIINPWFFYWIEVVNGLAGFFVVMMVLPVLFTIAFIVASVDEEEFERKVKKCLLITIPIFFIGMFGLIFMPTSDTLIKMKLAEHATPDKIKQIIEYGDTIKDELKKDVIDILRESKKEEAK